MLSTGKMDDKRYMEDLVVSRHVVLCHEIMLAEHVAVICRVDERRVIPHAMSVHDVQNRTQMLICHQKQCCIAAANVLQMLLITVRLVIFRPQVQRTSVVIPHHVQILLRDLKRLMGIKRFHPQEEIIPVMVLFQPLCCLLHSHDAGISLLGAVELLSVAGILWMHLAYMLRHGISGEYLRIPFLSSHELPLVELLAVVLPSDLKVVVVVGEHMC